MPTGSGTHHIDEAEYCQRVALMDAGELVALDAPAALRAAYAARETREGRTPGESPTLEDAIVALLRARRTPGGIAA